MIILFSKWGLRIIFNIGFITVAGIALMIKIAGGVLATARIVEKELT